MASLARAIHAHWLGVPWLVDDCLGNLRRPIRFMVLPGGHLTRACSRRADRSYLGPSPRGARLMRRAVRDFGVLRLSVRSAHVDSHTHTRPGKHVDECVDAEQLDLPAHEITNPWLRDPDQLAAISLAHEAGSVPGVGECASVPAAAW